MAQYEKVFTKPYEDGYVDLPNQTTPITAETLNDKDAAIEHIENYLHDNDANGNLADDYDSTATYSIGDYAVYEGVLYRCITAVSTAEDFDDDKWESVLITDVMGGGGGGSTVSITPTLSTGTKIADFEIDGESGELYAPTGGGGSANIWTGTMAEYEAQASQIPNDTLVNITDDEGEIEVGGEYYSTDERCVGTWTDGKPLYQKTIAFNALTSGANNKINNTITITNYKIIEFSGTVFLADGVNELAIPYVTSSQQLSAFFSDGVYVFVSSNLSVASGYLTIKYTKNSDTAIPLATKTTPSYEVYSTDEQIIGQWIDGKPIYRKIIQPNITTSSTMAGDIKYGALTLSNYISNVDMAWCDISMSYCIPSTGATRGFISAQYEQDSGGLILSTLFARTNVPSVLVMTYTKTTD